MNARVKYLCACLGVLACWPMAAMAATEVARTELKIKVTVLKPPCSVNGNKPVEVDFGEVMTTSINGKDYRRQLVEYTLDCKGKGAWTAMRLQVSGKVGFDNTALGTSIDGLAIRFQKGQGGDTLPVNKWLNFTYPNKPELWAVPTMEPGATLKAGAFSASATLSVDYQ